jgi:hypothetical protein
MRRDDPPGQRDIGEIVAKGVDARIERQGRTGQAKTVSRAGG